MKRYVRSANKFTNKATQLVSKAYSDEKIAEKAATGSRKGESMMQIFDNIMHDPHITFGEPDKGGNQDIYYDGTNNIGWVNFQRGMGWIDDKAYQKLEKYVAPEIPEEDYDDECYGDECYDEDDFDDEEY